MYVHILRTICGTHIIVEWYIYSLCVYVSGSQWVCTYMHVVHDGDPKVG